MDVRVVQGDQNKTPIVALDVRALLRANAIPVVQVNVSGDIVNPGGSGGSGGDGAVVDGANSAIKATVKQYNNSNPIAVVLVNVSGDPYGIQPGAAAANVNINQVGGQATAVNAGAADNGTLRVVVATDQGVIPVRQSGPFSTAVTGDVLLRAGGPTIPVAHQGPLGVQVVGGAVGGSVAVSGDVLLRGGGPTIPVAPQGQFGVQIVGGGPSGDVNVQVRPGNTLIGRVVAHMETSAIYSGSDPLTPVFIPISASGSGVNAIVSGVAQRRIRVLSYLIMSAGTVNAKFQSSTAGDITGKLPLIANVGASVGHSPLGHFQSASGEGLNINLSAAVEVGGHLTYVVV